MIRNDDLEPVNDQNQSRVLCSLLQGQLSHPPHQVLCRGVRVSRQKQVTPHLHMEKQWNSGFPSLPKKMLEILDTCPSLTTRHTNISKYKLSVMPFSLFEAGICMVFTAAMDKVPGLTHTLKEKGTT